MKLIRLKLEYFRQHRDSEIEFRDGITAIVGPNGSGKSTIIEAITHALYGEQRDNKDTLRFLFDTKPYRVVLEFELTGRRLRVMRKLNDATFEEYQDGRWGVRATKITEVNLTLHRELGLNYVDFKNSYCAEQKKLTFLDFDTSDRRKRLGQLFGYHQFERASEVGAKRAKDANTRSKALASTLEDDVAIQTELVELTKKISTAREGKLAGEQKSLALTAKTAGIKEHKDRADRYLHLLGVKATLKSSAAALTEAKRKATEALATARTQETRRRELVEVPTRANALDEQIGTLDQLYKAEVDRSRRAERHRTLADSVLAAEKELAGLPDSDLEGAIDSVRVALAAVTDAKKELEQRKREGETATSEAAKVLASAEAELKGAKKAKLDAEDLVAAGKCPTCGQPTSGEALVEQLRERSERVGEAERLVEVAGVALKAAKDERGKREAEAFSVLVAAEAIHRTAQDAEQRARDQRTTRQNKQTELEKRRSERDQAEKAVGAATGYDPDRHANLKDERRKLQPSLDEYMSVKDAEARLAKAERDAEEAKDAHQAASNQYQEATAELATLGFEDEAAANAAVGNYAAHQADLVQTQTELSFLEKSLVELEDRRRLAQKRAETLVERRREIETLEHDIKVMDATKLELRRCGEMLTDEVKPTLEALASLHLEELTGGRYGKLTLDSGFKPQLHDEDEKVKSVISGGEQDIVDLACRLALSEMLQMRSGRPLSLLILDEVFSSLDDQRRGRVLDRLDYLKPRFDQILVITHLDDINQRAENTIWVDRDPASRSSVIRHEGFAAPQDLFALAAADEGFEL